MALHQAEADKALADLYSRLLETERLAHLGSWEWDVLADEVRWSDELYRLYGHEPGSIAVDYESYLGLLHPDDRDLVNGHVQEAFKTGRPFSFEHRLVRPDGEVRWLHGRGEVVMGPAGPVRMFGTALDITDQKRAQERIEASLREKEVLLREVHHRVKNNLQVIASMLSLRGKQVTDPEAATALHDSRDRVRSMALVHETLYRADDLEKLDLSSFLRRLTADLLRAHETDRTRVRLEQEVKADGLTTDQTIHVGLIISELLSNAFKHAFPGGKEGTIRLQVHHTDETFVMAVEDDGVGIPEDMDPLAGDSLGMQLVATFAQQLGGSMDFHGAQGGGTRVEVRFPEAA